MSETPKVIWAAPREYSGWKIAGATDEPADGCEQYHHASVLASKDAQIAALAEVLERAEMMMRMRGYLEMAGECRTALAALYATK